MATYRRTKSGKVKPESKLQKLSRQSNFDKFRLMGTISLLRDIDSRYTSISTHRLIEDIEYMMKFMDEIYRHRKVMIQRNK